MKAAITFITCAVSIALFAAEPPQPNSSDGKKASAAPHCPDCEKSAPSLVLGVSTATPWLAPALRIKKTNLDYSVSNQSGITTKLASLNDRPMAITFLYTRCTNKNKCPLAATTMAQLRDTVGKLGLSEKVRLAIITYDPEYDTPARLKRYGEQKGIKFDDCIQMLQPPLDAKDKIFKEMDITVNYNDGMVNIHGIQLVLLDKNGRIVRNYHTVIWDNNKVAEDLVKLASE